MKTSASLMTGYFSMLSTLILCFSFSPVEGVVRRQAGRGTDAGAAARQSFNYLLQQGGQEVLRGPAMGSGNPGIKDVIPRSKSVSITSTYLFLQLQLLFRVSNYTEW